MVERRLPAVERYVWRDFCEYMGARRRRGRHLDTLGVFSGCSIGLEVEGPVCAHDPASDQNPPILDEEIPDVVHFNQSFCTAPTIRAERRRLARSPSDSLPATRRARCFSFHLRNLARNRNVFQEGGGENESLGFGCLSESTSRRSLIFLAGIPPQYS